MLALCAAAIFLRAITERVFFTNANDFASRNFAGKAFRPLRCFVVSRGELTGARKEASSNEGGENREGGNIHPGAVCHEEVESGLFVIDPVG